MNYNSKEIKRGIKLHCINTNKFKTNLLAVFITVPLSRKEVTFNTLIPAVLKRGTANLKTQEEIAKKLEEMYGAEFNCGIDKIGDNHIIKFYLETLNDNFIPSKLNLLNDGIDMLLDIVFNPLMENGKFKDDYVEFEKKNIKLLIESKIDNKAKFALDRCIEEMYKDKPYGLYRYGYVEDLDTINSENLYNYYLKLIKNSKIDIFVSGEIEDNEIERIVENKIKNLEERESKIIKNDETTEIKEEKEISVIQEKKDVNQGKLILGLDITNYNENSRYANAIYNVILGESATSKMFQNVREKASLAYTAGSNYVRQKNNIYIRCGIEIENYEKAVELIKEQLRQMKDGEFTKEDLENAKKYMISGIQSVEDEQDSSITYCMGQELNGKFIDFNEYVKKIEVVTREEIINVANSIKINTIYFLRN